MRILPPKFGKSPDGEYTKGLEIGRVENTIILFDSHGDIVDISSPLRSWKIQRVIRKLRSLTQ